MAKDDKDTTGGRTVKLPFMVWQDNEEAKKWLKSHRTLVASMSSSVISTYVAVSEVCKLHRLGH